MAPRANSRAGRKVAEGADRCRRGAHLSTPRFARIDRTGTSRDPVILSIADIDIEGSQTKGLSNKIFTHFSYAWLDNEDWTPYIGIGAEIEFAQQNGDCNKPSCNTNPCAANSCSGGSCFTTSGCSTCDTDCMRCGISQWGVWIKGGISFN